MCVQITGTVDELEGGVKRFIFIKSMDKHYDFFTFLLVRSVLASLATDSKCPEVSNNIIKRWCLN